MEELSSESLRKRQIIKNLTEKSNYVTEFDTILLTNFVKSPDNRLNKVMENEDEEIKPPGTTEVVLPEPSLQDGKAEHDDSTNAGSFAKNYEPLNTKDDDLFSVALAKEVECEKEKEFYQSEPDGEDGALLNECVLPLPNVGDLSISQPNDSVSDWTVYESLLENTFCVTDFFGRMLFYPMPSPQDNKSYTIPTTYEGQYRYSNRRCLEDHFASLEAAGRRRRRSRSRHKRTRRSRSREGKRTSRRHGLRARAPRSRDRSHDREHSRRTSRLFENDGNLRNRSCDKFSRNDSERRSTRLQRRSLDRKLPASADSDRHQSKRNVNKYVRHSGRSASYKRRHRRRSSSTERSERQKSSESEQAVSKPE